MKMFKITTVLMGCMLAFNASAGLLEDDEARRAILDLRQKLEVGQQGAKALAQNTTLKVLVLNNNNIGGEGAKALAEALKTNTTLTNLNLGSNQIGDEGARAIADALQTNTRLISLNLEFNQI